MTNAPEPPGTPRDEDLHRKLAGRSVTNVLGALAKGLYPLYVLIATRIFGADAAGLLLLALGVVRFTSGLVGAGYKSGIVMYGGRYLGRDDARFMDAIANGLWAVLFVSAAVVGALWSFGDALVAWYNPEYAAAGLDRVLLLAALALPLLGAAEMAIAALGAGLRMRYDALVMGLARPLLLVVCTVAAAFVDRSPAGLAAAFAVAHGGVFVLAWMAFARHHRLTDLAGRIVRPRFDAALFRYALPQSLNMTFNYFMADVDLFMLGGFGVGQAQLALYGIGAQVVRNIRQVKLAIGGAYAPVAARLVHDGEHARLADVTGMLSRWALLVAIPLAVLVLGLRAEILAIFHPSFYDPEAADFMLYLVTIPLLSCGLGLAGNLVTMAGKSHLNLANAVIGGVTNVLLDLVLIPRMGLAGAALASLLASVGVSLAQVVEARRIVGVPLSPRPLVAPATAGLLSGLVLWASFAVPTALPPLAGHAMGVGAALLVYVLVLRALGLEARDLAAFRRPELG
ncbi:MAG: polysaccharide biosynthesis protein [Deltaproteobacteria bacterium]|nr:MAG: polysaccharide biosynthesis protein [Deltaproteobacteria bacterium]